MSTQNTPNEELRSLPDSESDATPRRTVHRQARGERRRRTILDATLRVIGREGVAGVTHRAVAAEAEVPLASTTYYFESKADLLCEAFRYYAERSNREVDRSALRAVNDAGGALPEPADAIEAFVSYLVTDLTERRESLAAEYELHLEASRRPELRALSQRWHVDLTDRLTDWLAKLGSPEPANDAFLVEVALTGLELETLSLGEGHVSIGRIHSAIDRLLRSLLFQPSGPVEA
ncbi:MAG: TetR/AcrR family transcriptional regulator [Myxococcota bacterium]